MLFLAVVDGGGAYGLIFQQAFTILLSLCTALIFVHFWRRGSLDMDESAKMQMFDPDHDGEGGDCHERR